MATLVTGCAGYIGSITSKLLLEAGEEVIGIDNLSRNSKDNIPEELKFYQACISDTVMLEKIFKEHDIENVMHFAAYIEVAESTAKPELYKENNFEKSIKFINKLLDLDLKNFVFSSTAAVYGNPGKSGALREDDEKSPINPYGKYKLEVENYLYGVSRKTDFNYVALRYFNVVGAYGRFGEYHDPETHLLPIVIDSLLGKRPNIKIFGTDYDTPDGSAVRDYIHVVDLGQAHINVLDLFKNNETDKLNQAYNLGYNKGFSVLEIVNAVEKVSGKKLDVEHTDRRPGDPATLLANNQKAINAGFFKPKKDSIEEIIKDAYEHRSKHFYHEQVC